MAGKRRRNGGNGRSGKRRNFKYKSAPKYLEQLYKTVPSNMPMNAVPEGWLGIEKKFFDTSASAAVASSATMTGGTADPIAPVSCLNAVAQGDGPSNRDGKHIVVKSVQVNGVIDWEYEADGTPNNIGAVFIALVLDKRTNGAQMVSQDVFTNPQNTADTCVVPLRNLLKSTRFQVLKTWTIHKPRGDWCPSTTTGQMRHGSQDVPFSCYLKMNLQTRFNETNINSDIANIEDNSLHIVAFTNDASRNPTLKYNARIRFVG